MMIEEVRKRGYKVLMSKGDPIQVDAEELEKVFNGVARGAIIKLKRGIINPSYFVSVVEDVERRQRWLEDTKYDDEKRSQGMAQLKDIFDDKRVNLPKGVEQKRLEG